jgi:hypothetical protein
MTPIKAAQLYKYDNMTGVVTHAFDKGCFKEGSVVGYVTVKGQVVTSYSKKQIMVSHICWMILTGLQVPSGSIVDHINGDAKDNREDNIRLTNHTGNNRNSRKPSHNTTGVKGLTWTKNRKAYRAFIKVNGKQVYLGTHQTLDAGKDVLEAARAKYHGEYANNG